MLLAFPVLFATTAGDGGTTPPEPWHGLPLFYDNFDSTAPGQHPKEWWPSHRTEVVSGPLVSTFCASLFISSLCPRGRAWFQTKLQCETCHLESKHTSLSLSLSVISLCSSLSLCLSLSLPLALFISLSLSLSLSPASCRVVSRVVSCPVVV